jgi:hypothetical protein
VSTFRNKEAEAIHQFSPIKIVWLLFPSYENLLILARLRNDPGQPGTIWSGFRSGPIRVEVFQGPDQGGSGWPTPKPEPETRQIAKSPPRARQALFGL